MHCVRTRELKGETVSEEADLENQTIQPPVRAVIFLVHTSDDWSDHGSICERCCLLLLRCAPQPL